MRSSGDGRGPGYFAYFRSLGACQLVVRAYKGKMEADKAYLDKHP